MDPHCHRCGATLASSEVFCANCGAPQLRLEEGSEDARQGAIDRRAQRVDPRTIPWKSAIGAAVSVAVPVGLLSSRLFPPLSGACCLWGMGASIAAVALYRRRAAAALLDASTGMRIGLLVGLLSSFSSAAANAAWLLIHRYALHGGTLMDRNWETQMEQATQATAQLFPQLPQQASQMSLHFWLSPDGRAAGELLNAIVFSVGMLVFSTIGGALGARIFTTRTGAFKSS
jgi:hypothetical protein